MGTVISMISKRASPEIISQENRDEANNQKGEITRIYQNRVDFLLSGEKNNIFKNIHKYPIDDIQQDIYKNISEYKNNNHSQLRLIKKYDIQSFSDLYDIIEYLGLITEIKWDFVSISLDELGVISQRIKVFFQGRTISQDQCIDYLSGFKESQIEEIFYISQIFGFIEPQVRFLYEIHEDQQLMFHERYALKYIQENKSQLIGNNLSQIYILNKYNLQSFSHLYRLIEENGGIQGMKWENIRMKKSRVNKLLDLVTVRFGGKIKSHKDLIVLATLFLYNDLKRVYHTLQSFGMLETDMTKLYFSKDNAFFLQVRMKQILDQRSQEERNNRWISSEEFQILYQEFIGRNEGLEEFYGYETLSANIQSLFRSLGCVVQDGGQKTA